MIFQREQLGAPSSIGSGQNGTAGVRGSVFKFANGWMIGKGRAPHTAGAHQTPLAAANSKEQANSSKAMRMLGRIGAIRASQDIHCHTDQATRVAGK